MLLHGLRESTILIDLSAENEKSELSIGQEDNEKHDGETNDVFGASTERHAELGHCFVEAHVFEDLDPSEEDHERERAIENALPVAEEIKVKVLVIVGE